MLNLTKKFLSVDDARDTSNPFSNSILPPHNISNLIIWMTVYEGGCVVWHGCLNMNAFRTIKNVISSLIIWTWAGECINIVSLSWYEPRVAQLMQLF